MITIHLRSSRCFDEVYVLRKALGGEWTGGDEVLGVSNRPLGKPFDIDSVIQI